MVGHDRKKNKKKTVTHSDFFKRYYIDAPLFNLNLTKKSPGRSKLFLKVDYHNKLISNNSSEDILGYITSS